jgi:hypothetical protein
MLLLLSAGIAFIAGSLFLGYELVKAPVGFEDATGFHVAEKRVRPYVGSGMLKRSKRAAVVASQVIPGVGH